METTSSNKGLNKIAIIAALKKLSDAALELSNALDENGYQLSNSAPEYIRDADDFYYEVNTFVEDEIHELIKADAL